MKYSGSNGQYNRHDCSHSFIRHYWHKCLKVVCWPMCYFKRTTIRYIHISRLIHTPVDELVLNRIKYYLRSLDFMLIKSLPSAMYNSLFAK